MTEFIGIEAVRQGCSEAISAHVGAMKNLLKTRLLTLINK